jgi:hypothetical protein
VLAFSTGSVEAEQDAADLRLARAMGAAAASVLRVDPLAGHAGAAAPALAVALGALALAGRGGAGSALALARDPDGGMVLARLERAPEAHS